MIADLTDRVSGPLPTVPEILRGVQLEMEKLNTGHATPAEFDAAFTAMLKSAGYRSMVRGDYDFAGLSEFAKRLLES
jgi:hypothetical protein